MRLFWVFTLFIFLSAGCSSSLIPFSDSPATVQNDLQPQTINPQTAEVHPGGDAVMALPVDTLPVEVESPVLLPPVPQEAVVETESLDAETLADNRVLQGVDQDPPELEGQTLAHREPQYDFPVVENDKVRYFVDYYTGRARKTFKIWLERSTKYLPMMRGEFAAAGLPQDLAYLAMVESGFNDKAYSWAHAVGPWQFIESTGRRYGLDNDWWWDERRDPVKATRAAAAFLGDLHKQFDGDWYLAVASYNAGPGKLRTAIRKYKTRDFWEICHGSHLRTETKNYVPKLLAVLMIAKQPEKYGFTDLEYQQPLEFETATLPTSTDLDVIARLCGVDYETIKKLNPELKRWSSPPTVKNYQVHLPAGSLELFSAQYAQLPVEKRANYIRHKVKSGDTVLALAKRYRVRTDDILRLNRIRNARSIQIGTNLIVPLNPDYNKRPIAELKDDYKRSRRKTYTVRSGDSLWSISRRFGVTEKNLRVWNRLGWSNVIRPGQRLVVSSKAVSSKKRVSVKMSSGPGEKLVYHVKPGDTLWAIGRQFAVETHQIRDWNGLSSNHVLMPGDRLTLMVSKNVRG
jgi:membrane-bound lytic murein transglycosylase D